MAANVLKVAQSKLEWLRDTLMRVFDHTRENPFACRRVSTGVRHDMSWMMYAANHVQSLAHAAVAYDAFVVRAHERPICDPTTQHRALTADAAQACADLRNAGRAQPAAARAQSGPRHQRVPAGQRSAASAVAYDLLPVSLPWHWAAGRPGRLIAGPVKVSWL